MPLSIYAVRRERDAWHPVVPFARQRHYYSLLALEPAAADALWHDLGLEPVAAGEDDTIRIVDLLDGETAARSWLAARDRPAGPGSASDRYDQVVALLVIAASGRQKGATHLAFG